MLRIATRDVARRWLHAKWDSSALFETFTERARQVVVLAHEEARALKNNYIGTEHILLGLLREEEGLAARVLESLQITAARVRAHVLRIVVSSDEVTSGQVPFTPRAKKVLELALREALSIGHDYVGTEHILLSLVREHDGVAARILLDFDVDTEMIRDEVIRMLSAPGAQGQARSTPLGVRPGWRLIDQAWLRELGAVLDRLAAEIRTELKRAPDTGDLLVALAHAPDTLAARALYELGINLDGLAGLIEHVRAEASPAEEERAQRILELDRAKVQAIEEQRFQDAARLRDRERELRQQAGGRTAAEHEVLQTIRRQLGITSPSTDPPPSQS